MPYRVVAVVVVFVLTDRLSTDVEEPLGPTTPVPPGGNRRPAGGGPSAGPGLSAPARTSWTVLAVLGVVVLLALVVSLVATVLKFGDRTQIGAVHLATSLVADLQLIAAAIVWTYATHASAGGLTPHALASVVSLAVGALLANLVSVVMLVAETLSFQRR